MERNDFEQTVPTEIDSRFAENVDFQGVVLTTVLSTGIVIWVMQGAQVLATIASAAPAWGVIDPLIVLSQERLKVGSNEEEERVLSVFDTEQRHPHQDKLAVKTAQPGVSV